METLTFKTLFIDVSETDAEVRLSWRGKSDDRDPARFLVPVLTRGLERGENGKRTLVLDFSAMDYMNSSTFSPLVKLLDQAGRGAHKVHLEFSQGRKWQSLSFTALKAFETGDGRVRVYGK